MTLTFRQFMEQMPPPPPMGDPMGGDPMMGDPMMGDPMMGGAPPGPQEMPDWNALAYELGIEPKDLEGQTFVGSWIGPDANSISNLGAFTIQGVDEHGDEIKGVKVDFIPTSQGGTKGLRDYVKGEHSRKWRVVPRGARTNKRQSRFLDYDWLNKVLFQHQTPQAGGGGAIGALPGAGGMPSMGM